MRVKISVKLFQSNPHRGIDELLNSVEFYLDNIEIQDLKLLDKDICSQIRGGSTSNSYNLEELKVLGINKEDRIETKFESDEIISVIKNIRKLIDDLKSENIKIQESIQQNILNCPNKDYLRNRVSTLKENEEIINVLNKNYIDFTLLTNVNYISDFIE